MVEIFIYLLAAVIAVPIASRLGLGAVLGYLIAGILIGPFGLAVSDDSEEVMHIAEFGVVIMLFLIGLELRPTVLWQMRNAIMGLGGAQVLLTTALIGAIGYALGLSWQSALAVGLILALSSTAIALQMFEEKNLLRSASGNAGFSVLLFQDIAVIPILALLPLLVAGADRASSNAAHASAIDGFSGGTQALLIIGSVAAIVVAGRYLTRPFFRYVAHSGHREVFTALTLLLVVGIFLLMSLVGLSPALGAFTAGVVLANNEYRHEIEANIEPFKGLLLGLFFISVGSQIDIALILEKPLMLGGLVWGLVTLKFLVLWGLAQLYGLRLGQRFWFAFTLAQGGEFGFVLLTFSLNNHVLDAELVQLLTAAITVSMMLTPISILINEKLIQPRLETREDDDYAETLTPQHNPVIVAGFGRFGQIAARLLMANGIGVTVLDNSGSAIERYRRFGFKVFYGDAARADLLRTAGADKATLLIVAADDRDKIGKIIKTAKRHFPNLTVYTRAIDVIHYHELQALKVDHIEREVFLGSLHTGELALTALGMPAYQARRTAANFARHDRRTIQQLSRHTGDRNRYVSAVRQAEEELVALLNADREQLRNSPDNAWDRGPE